MLISSEMMSCAVANSASVHPVPLAVVVTAPGCVWLICSSLLVLSNNRTRRDEQSNHANPPSPATRRKYDRPPVFEVSTAPSDARPLGRLDRPVSAIELFICGVMGENFAALTLAGRVE